MNWSTSQVAEVYRKRGSPNPIQQACDSSAPTSKYHARKKELDGHLFDSVREANVYRNLIVAQAAGAISGLELQPRFLLQEGFRTPDGKKQRRIEYVADFSYLDLATGRRRIIDVKGFKTAAYRLKAKLFMAKYHDIQFEEWK